jgi:hypothetical protein
LNSIQKLDSSIVLAFNIPMDNNTENILKSLESLYLEKEYQKAIDLIIKSSQQFDKGLFHYNLGTMHVKLGHLGVARYHLERAKKFDFKDTKLSSNLKFVRESLGVSDVVQSKVLWDRFLNFSLGSSVQSFFSLSLVILLVGAFLFRPSRLVKKWKFIFVVLVSIIPTLFYFTFLKDINFAVALKGADLREGPSKVYEKNNYIPEGAKVILGEKNGSWFYIERPTWLRGWISKDDVGRF